MFSHAGGARNPWTDVVRTVLRHIPVDIRIEHSASHRLDWDSVLRRSTLISAANFTNPFLNAKPRMRQPNCATELRYVFIYLLNQSKVRCQASFAAASS